MSRLKFMSELEPPSQACHPLRGKTKKLFPLLVAVLTGLIFLLFLPIIQELIHRFVLVYFRVHVYTYDIDDGVSLDLP